MHGKMMRRKKLPGLCFWGEAGAAAGVDEEDLGSLLGSLLGESSFSASILSSRASTPATACERKDPHPAPRLPGAAMASTYVGKFWRAGSYMGGHQANPGFTKQGIWTVNQRSIRRLFWPDPAGRWNEGNRLKSRGGSPDPAMWLLEQFCGFCFWVWRLSLRACAIPSYVELPRSCGGRARWHGMFYELLGLPLQHPYITPSHGLLAAH